MDTPNLVESARDLALASAEEREIEGHPYKVTPDGYETEDLEKFLPAPLRIREHVNLSTLESFISYVERFKTNDTAIFGEATGKLAAILDYHGVSKPSWRTHRVVFVPAQTVEWVRWMGSNEKWLEQRAFAEFLEANVDDIVFPSGAYMLEIASTLEQEATTKAGEKGTLDVPALFKLAVATFIGGDTYPLLARFRHKIYNGTLALRYQLVNPRKVVEAAVTASLEKVTTGTGIKPYIGTAP